jgi:signal transduction histidine kinase
MRRTLRTKLTVLNIVIAIVLLGLSTILTIVFSTRALESQAYVYAHLLVHQVALYAQTQWRADGRSTLEKGLQAIAKEDDHHVVIEIFLFQERDDAPISTRPGSAIVALTPEERQAVQAGNEYTSFISLEGRRWIHITVPLRSAEQVIGAVRLWTRVIDIHRLRTDEVGIALLFGAIFVVGLLFVLKGFFDRQINHPLERLITTIRAAETGNLATRSHLNREDEIGQLGAHFDRMLTRLEQSDTENRRLLERLQRFNEELEARVQQVTQELVLRNRELLRLQRERTRVEPLAALGRITGSIAHELGTPLNSVLGYSQLLAQEALSNNAREHVQIIESQVHRMAAIIQHYLSHTRDAAACYQPVNVNTLIQETLRLLAPVFQQHQIRVRTVLAEALPPIQGDSTSLQRVLFNLLNNAVDAIDNDGTVTINTRVSSPTDAARSGVIVEVMDTGTGIPPDVLPRVFTLFVTTKEPGKGTGLGLAICQEIVKNHGGSLNITSEVGKGTQVWIFLPFMTQSGVVPSQEAPQ